MRVSGYRGFFRVLMGMLVALSVLLPVAESSAAASGNKSKKPVATKTVKKPPAKASRKEAAARKAARTKVAKARKKSRERQTLAKRRGDGAPAIRTAAHSSRSAVTRAAAPARQTVGERLGLRASDDPLNLNSSVALVVDQDTSEVLFSKNDSAVLPIASLTKLMTGLVVADANLPMDEQITITSEDIDTYKGSRSRLAVGTTLSRGELMHLALMSSENRAAHALGRTFPGGMEHFVRLMNAKARELGMYDTRYVEPTGLLSQNQSSARDLATLVSVAYQRPILRELSTSQGYELSVGRRVLQYNNSNRLVRSPEWDIGLQKTGYISEAGRCLVMQASVAGRKLIMVFLDSAGNLSRLRDAERVRQWVESRDPPMGHHPVTHVQQHIRPQG
ncbi:MAG: D-alanyl-D-alanine carboxypeptidase family protein [Gammaproteobacteria bacterium]